MKVLSQRENVPEIVKKMDDPAARVLFRTRPSTAAFEHGGSGSLETRHLCHGLQLLQLKPTRDAPYMFPQEFI